MFFCIVSAAISIMLLLRLNGVYKVSKREGDLPISFEQFYDMYKINKFNWQFYSYDTVEYNKHYHVRESFYFKTLFDWIKFKKFQKERKKLAANAEKQKRMLKILKSWQEDINDYRDDYIKDLTRERAKIEEAIKKFDRVL